MRGSWREEEHGKHPGNWWTNTTPGQGREHPRNNLTQTARALHPHGQRRVTDGALCPRGLESGVMAADNPTGVERRPRASPMMPGQTRRARLTGGTAPAALPTSRDECATQKAPPIRPGASTVSRGSSTEEKRDLCWERRRPCVLSPVAGETTAQTQDAAAAAAGPCKASDGRALTHQERPRNKATYNNRE